MSHFRCSILAFSINFCLLKLTCLVTLFDYKLQGFKSSQNWQFLAFPMNSKWNFNLLRSPCWMRLFLWRWKVEKTISSSLFRTDWMVSVLRADQWNFPMMNWSSVFWIPFAWKKDRDLWWVAIHRSIASFLAKWGLC